jgi:hypothetical protein
MTTSNLSVPKKSDNLLMHSIVSFATAFLLAFIDNGLSLLSELIRPGTWLGLVMCSVVILFGQAVVREVFFIKYTGKHKTKLTLLFGIPLGVFFLYLLLYLFGK